MPRLAWSHLAIALIALPLVSCFHDVGECPTCPGVDSGSIEVHVPRTGLVDSVQVSLNGGTQVTVRRNRGHAFDNLRPGLYSVAITRWFSDSEHIPSSRLSTVQVRIDRGETRVILFHNDFPLVAWAPMRETDPVIGRRGHRPDARRMG